MNNLQILEPNRKELPNNYDAETKSNEIKFISNFNLKEFKTEYIDSNETLTILNSRTLKKNYYCDSNFTIDDLGNFFKETGTTLTVDYERSYVRCAFWDIDCLCRVKNTNEHINEHDILHIENCIVNLFAIVGLKPTTSIWVSTTGCGFHIYTNISISLPFHLFLTKILNANYRANSKYIFELPRFMPLPYSAKVAFQPYKKYFYNNKNFNLLPSKNFQESMVYCKLKQQDDLKSEVGRINTLDTVYYMYMKSQTFDSDFIPKFKNIQDIDFNSDLDFMLGLKKYFELNEFKLSEKIEIYSKNSVLNEFIIDYNKSFSGDEIEDINWGRFIEHSTKLFGSLFLQHLIVLCHKFVLNHDFHYDLIEFKDALIKIFSKRNTSNDVMQFLERYNMYTYNNYLNEDYDEMKEYFQLIFKLNLFDPYISQTEILKSCLEKVHNIQIHKEISSMKTKDQINYNKIKEFLDKYIYFIKTFKFIIKQENAWYILNSNFYYKPFNTNNFPGINEWFGSKTQIKTFCIQYIKDSFPNTQNLWTDASIIIPTSVGNFNSLTGTYCIKSPFLRYTISRHRMIWKDLMKLKMYETQNEDVVEISKQLDHYATKMPEYMIKMFVYYNLVPAILDLENHSFIDGYMFYKIIDKIAGFDDLSDAHFIVEYIPVNVEFVHFVMCLMQEYDDYSILCSYKALVLQHFSNSYSDSVEKWKTIYQKYNGNLNFEKNTQSQMEALKSIESSYVSKPDERFCFLASIIAYCMYKCSEFEQIRNACNVHKYKKIPEALNENYPDKEYTTSLKDAQNNMKLAKKLVFGTNLDSLNTHIVNFICMIFTSCSFVLENVIEFFNIASCNCTINSERKKFILFKGDQDSGKSKWCEIFVSMNEPESTSIKNLTEAVSRSNVTQFCNLVSISEVGYEYAHMIKSITGVDKDSGKTFYTQDLTKSKTQAIMIGATNIDITFIKKKDEIIDRIACERIHAILMDGKHKADCHDTFIKMFVEKRFFRVEDVNSSLTNHVHSALWLSYIWYNKFKDDTNLYPINLNNKYVKEYQEKIYRKNNKIYDTICRLGLREEKDMYMESSRILDLFKKNLNEKELFNFTVDFNNYYEDLNKNAIINNIIESELYDHIVTNFEICESLNDCITSAELNDRSNIYEDKIQKANALSYFSQKNVKFFNKNSEKYENVKFKQTEERYKANSLNLYNFVDENSVEYLIKKL